MRNIVLAFCAMVLASCASLQDVTPKTPREALAAAEVTLIGTMRTVGILHDQGVITDDQLRGMIPRLKEADQLIRTAAVVIVTTPDPNQSDLQKALTALHAAIAIAYQVAGEARQSYDAVQRGEVIP